MYVVVNVCMWKSRIHTICEQKCIVTAYFISWHDVIQYNIWFGFRRRESNSKAIPHSTCTVIKTLISELITFIKYMDSLGIKL